MIYHTPFLNNMSYLHSTNAINQPENNRSVSFKGIKLNGLPEVEILAGVTPEYINKAFEAIQQYPKPLMQKILDAKFKIVFAESISDGINHSGISSKTILMDLKNNYQFQADNPLINLPGLTSYHPLNRNNYIILADRPQIREIPQKVVNHEFSHGVVNKDELLLDNNFTSAISKDRNALVKKLQNGDQLQKFLFERKFMGLTDKIFFHEVFADTIAWGCRNGGFYGSKLELQECHKHHADDHLMKKLFPNVISAINKRYRDAGLVYTIY